MSRRARRSTPAKSAATLPPPTPPAPTATPPPATTPEPAAAPGPALPRAAATSAVAASATHAEAATAGQPSPIVSGAPIALADHLRQLTAAVYWISESEAPLKVIELPPDAVLPDALRVLVELPPSAPAEEWSLADLLSPVADAPDGGALRAIQTFLETRLTRASAYKVGGEARKYVFFLGRQPDKAWLGVQTEAVET